MRATVACSLGLVALILIYRRRKKIIGGVILRVAGSGAELHQRPRSAEATQSLATRHDGGPDRISAEQWALFDERGFVVLPHEQVFEPGELEALQVQLDDLLVGRAESTTVQLDAPMVQLRYADAAEGTQTPGSKGTSLRYRSLESLGLDPLVEAFMRKPLFDAACQRVYGDSTPVASLRTVLSSEPSRHAGGAVGVAALPWQQDRCSFLGERTPQTPNPESTRPPMRPPTRPPAHRSADASSESRTPSPSPSPPRQTASLCSPPTWRWAPPRPPLHARAVCSCCRALTSSGCSTPAATPDS